MLKQLIIYISIGEFILFTFLYKIKGPKNQKIHLVKTDHY